MEVMKASTYMAYLASFIADGGATGQRRGAVQRLGEALKCHPTFISHVLAGKAHFSPEQATRFCQHAKLNEAETDYFIDLVARDRAGDQATRDVYERRLKAKKSAQTDMRSRWQTPDELSVAQQSLYYDSWVPSAVHMYCQTKPRRGEQGHSVDSVAQALGLAIGVAERTLRSLCEIGVLVMDGLHFKSAIDSVHTGRNSPFLTRSHVNWRVKTVHDLSTKGATLGLHYSSLMSMATVLDAEVRDEILACLDKIRQRVEPSKPESLHVLTIDYFPLCK